jgi:hypothetical protein
VRQETVVLSVDLVESVRLMRGHEGPSVRRWTDFVRIVPQKIIVVSLPFPTPTDARCLNDVVEIEKRGGGNIEPP